MTRSAQSQAPLLTYVQDYLTQEPTTYDSNAGVNRLREYVYQQTGVRVKRTDLTDLAQAQGLTTNTFDRNGRLLR